MNKIPGINRLLLKPVDNEQKTSGGLILTDSFETATQKTIILAVGKTKESWSVGDVAYIQKHTGLDIGLGELVVLEQEILYTTEK